MRRFLFALIWFLPFSGIAQSLDRYVVFFTDKNNSPFNIASPQSFLSQRAINRRTAQNISIISQDLPVNPAYVDSVISKGAQILNRSKWFNAVVIRTNDPAVLSAIQALPFVSSTTVAGRVINIGTEPAEDSFKRSFVNPYMAAESNLKTGGFSYGSSFNQIAMLNGHLLHDQGFAGQGKLIAIIDAGFSDADIMTVFDSLRANNQIKATWDFVDGNANVYDDHWHGMMVLSLIGGYIPNELVGTAPKADFLLLRSEDAPTEYIIEEYNWAAAAEYADSAGADVINTSLGYTLFDESAMDHSYNQMDGNTIPITIAADIAATKGMLVVNSAGNEGNSAWYHISAAADGDSVLAIGAVDAFETYVGFSGKGPSFDGRVKPNVTAQGGSAIVASSGGGTQTGSGTSFSGPIVAGLAACLWQANPIKNNMEIFRAIEQSADQYLTPDEFKGYGVPDFALANLNLSAYTISDPGSEQLMSVYPNPFEDRISVRFYSDKSQDLNFGFHDITGKLIFNQIENVLPYSINTITIDTPSDLSKGIYFLEMKTARQNYVRKIVRF